MDDFRARTSDGVVSVHTAFDGQVELAVVKDGSRGIIFTELAPRQAAQLGNALLRAAAEGEATERNVA